MRRPVSLILGVMVGMVSTLPTQAQQFSKDHVRAVNAARMRAESINGGLSQYRAAKCMYATSRGGAECLKSKTDGFLFVFGGGAPGWQEEGQPASVETEIRVSADGSSDIDVIYNGAPR